MSRMTSEEKSAAKAKFEAKKREKLRMARNADFALQKLQAVSLGLVVTSAAACGVTIAVAKMKPDVDRVYKEANLSTNFHEATQNLQDSVDVAYDIMAEKGRVNPLTKAEKDKAFSSYIKTLNDALQKDGVDGRNSMRSAIANSVKDPVSRNRETRDYCDQMRNQLDVLVRVVNVGHLPLLKEEVNKLAKSKSEEVKTASIVAKGHSHGKTLVIDRMVKRNTHSR